MTLIECIPNFSEGRRPEVIEQIAAAVRSRRRRQPPRRAERPHPQPLRRHLRRPRGADRRGGVPRHPDGGRAHRPERARGRASALRRRRRRAVRAAALRGHAGLRRDGAAARPPRVAAELEIPVFLYEDAARIPEHKNLAVIRGKGFEEMREVIGSEPVEDARTKARRACTRRPGPSPSARASRSSPTTSTSSRTTSSWPGASRVEIRERDGGMKCVKAMGLQLEDGAVQVSMNLTDYRVTSMADVVAAIGERAAAAGVPIRESEVVGLLPQDALVRLAQVGAVRDGLQPRPGPRGPRAGHAAVNAPRRNRSQRPHPHHRAPPDAALPDVQGAVPLGRPRGPRLAGGPGRGARRTPASPASASRSRRSPPRAPSRRCAASSRSSSASRSTTWRG